MAQQQSFFPQELLLHTLLRNRYIILSEVGAGGFGSVYKARDIQSGDRLVAIKEVRLLGLHPKAMLEATTAFQREASVLSQLDHPNLPRLYEHFQNPGHWYLVMDFIAGETLEQYQSKAPNRRLLLSEVLDIGLQLCIVLDYLHSQQPPIVFRDLKPANIMRTRTVLQARTGQRHCRPWFTGICRPRAVWQSTNHSTCRYLQLRGSIASITNCE